MIITSVVITVDNTVGIGAEFAEDDELLAGVTADDITTINNY